MCIPRTFSVDHPGTAKASTGRFYRVILFRFEFSNTGPRTALQFRVDMSREMSLHGFVSVIMLLFREEKSPEDEIKAWQFWHSRQHSVKQRILDADTKNSVGLAGCIEEVSHNAIAVYWNPLESSAKVSFLSVCQSTIR
uniref:Grh/CP2 DB domain-containing protein n=1 Tax=Anopheles culicifacies TaxID=139723 RepID=A0A182MEV2_9DIPT